MDKYDVVQQCINELAVHFNERTLQARRNRFLVLLASHSTLPIREIVALRMWQLTRFCIVAHDEVDIANRVRIDLEVTFTLGLYLDDSFQKISPLHKFDQRLARRYIGTLSEFSSAESAIFPVIRKNGRADPARAISVKDARHIIQEAYQAQEQTKALSSYNLRHQAIASLLKRGCCIEEIQDESGYSDAKSIHAIAKAYDLPVRRDPNFLPPRRVGICIPGSVYEFYEHHYPKHLYVSPRQLA